MTAEDQKRLDAAKPKILVAWADRAKDPYGVCEAARDLVDDELRKRCGYDTITQMLSLQLGLSETDAEQIIHAVALGRRFPRTFVERHGWEQTAVLNDLVVLGEVILEPDPADTPIPVRNEHGRLVHKKFADCTLAELTAARDAALEKRKPKPQPHRDDPSVPTNPDLPTARAPAPWTLWAGLWFTALAFVLSGACLQAVAGLVGTVLLSAAGVSVWRTGARAVLDDVRGRFQSGDWPKRRGAAAIAILVVAAIGSRLWSPPTPFASITASLQSAARPGHSIPEVPAPAVPTASVSPGITPAAPAPMPHPATPLPEVVTDPVPKHLPPAAHHPQHREPVAAESPPPPTAPSPAPAPASAAPPAEATAAPPSTKPVGVNGTPLPAVWPWPEPPPPQYSDDLKGYAQRGLNAIGIRPDPPPKPLKQFRDEFYRDHPERTPPGWAWGPEDAGH